MTEEQKNTSEKPLDKMTVTELREIAKEIPTIVGAVGMKKSELLVAIKEAKGIVDEPGKKTGRPKAKVKITVAELKTAIRGFKIKRHDAIQKKDRKMADLYRRKISKLKKKTRNSA